jgi:hypothetical protein
MIDTANVATATALVAALAERLNHHVPGGFSVEASGTGVLVRREQPPQIEGVDIGWAFDDDLGLADKLTSASERVLDAVQDILSEALAEPWPRAGSASGETLPTPGAVVVGDELRSWYGAERPAALELDPIPMSALSAGR